MVTMRLDVGATQLRASPGVRARDAVDVFSHSTFHTEASRRGVAESFL